MVRGQVSQQEWRRKHRKELCVRVKKDYALHRERYKKKILSRQRLIRSAVAAITSSTDPESLFYKVEIVR